MAGGFTVRLGRVSRLRISTSLTSGGYSIALEWTSWTRSNEAMLTTNSLVLRILAAVSFMLPALRPTLIASIGGFAATKVKWLNGARLTMPASDKDVTHAM